MHLRDPIPFDVWQEVTRRADRHCEDCGNVKKLELHHLRYWTSPPHSEPIFGWETATDLAALCRVCHHNRHRDPNGQFWLDPEAMADHWWGYFNELERE
jgi:5-methylcytosine-specific restriction endonuclease McrA